MKKVNVVAVMVFLLFLGFQTSGHALPTLTINDHVNPIVTINDNGAGDSLPATNGAILWSGTIGVWSLIVETGQSKPFVGSATQPQMDLNSAVTSTGAGSLTITFSDPGFTLLGGFTFLVGGTSVGTSSYKVLIDGVTAGGPLAFSAGSFSGTTTGSTGAVTPYTMALVADITHTAGGITTVNEQVTTVPEPTSMLLLGFGLLALGFAKRRKS